MTLCQEEGEAWWNSFLKFPIIRRRKVPFLKTNVCSALHLSSTSIKAKWEPEAYIVCTHSLFLSLAHTLGYFLFCFYLKKNVISHSPSFPPKVRTTMEAWNNFRGSDWRKLCKGWFSNWDQNTATCHFPSQLLFWHCPLKSSQRH